MNKQCVNCSGRTDHDTADCKTFSPHSAETIQRLRETFEAQEKASGRSVELDESGDYIDPTVFFGWFGAVNGLSSSSSKHRPEFLAQAESCGARITGKPDGSEPIEIVFTVEAWRAFDVANRATLPVRVPDVDCLRNLLDEVRDVRNADDVAFGWYEAVERMAAPTVEAEQVGTDMKLPCEIKLPGGMKIGKGCTLSTLLLALRNRGDDMPWRQRFDAPIPFDPALSNLTKELHAPSLPAAGSAVETTGEQRYRVEPRGKGFWPYCVKAGDGERELYFGHKKDCDRVSAELATAFEDGKYIAALSAQQSAPERVSVPVELLQDLHDLASDAVEHHRAAFAGYKLKRQANMDHAVDKARALLASHAEGGKV